MKIAYLGPENSYSFLAAKLIAAEGDVLCPKPSFSDIFEELEEKAVSTCCADMGKKAVVPLENSTEGNVNEVTDSLIFGNAFITGELVLKIENYLLFFKGADPKNIKRIITHRQPYAQCRKTVGKLCPNAEIIFAESTSAAVSKVLDKETAAIGGIQLAKEKNLAGLAANDTQDNRTRFAVIEKTEKKSPENNKITIAFEAENKSGGLLRLLEILHSFGINMTRIESRPQKSALGRYVFIADISGNIEDNDVISALELIKRNTLFFKYLGNYISI